MSTNPAIMAGEINELSQAAQRDERIKQLERLNSVLSAEIDAQRPVVEAAQRWTRNDNATLRISLRTAVINYEAAKEQDAKVGS